MGVGYWFLDPVAGIPWVFLGCAWAHSWQARDAVSGRLLNDSWETWNAFRTMCEHHGQLSVALDIRASIPPPHALARWIGEPVKAAILHTSVGPHARTHTPEAVGCLLWGLARGPLVKAL